MSDVTWRGVRAAATGIIGANTEDGVLRCLNAARSARQSLLSWQEQVRGVGLVLPNTLYDNWVSDETREKIDDCLEAVGDAITFWD